MSLAIVWTELASTQLGDLHAYISEDNPVAAEQQLELIDSSATSLADFPEMGRPGQRSGTREFVVPRTPYIVAYRIKPDTIEILAVMHGAQRWPRGFR